MDRKRANVVTLSAWVILGRIKATEDEVEMLISALLDMSKYRDLEDDIIVRYEKNPRLAAEIILRKKTGEKEQGIQNLAREFLEQPAEQPAKPVAPILRPSDELLRNTPHKTLSQNYLKVRVNPNIRERHGIHIPRSLFNRIIAQEPGEFIAHVDRRFFARVMGYVDEEGVVEVHPKMDVKDAFVQLDIVKDLAPIEKIIFRFAGSEQEKQQQMPAIKMALEVFFRNLPAISLGQEIRVSPLILLRVQHLEPPVAYAKLPFDGDVPYEVQTELLMHRIKGCIACGAQARGMCACGMLYCGVACQKRDWEQSHSLECIY